MQAAPATAAEIQEGAKEDEVVMHDPIAGEVVRVVFSKLPDKQFFHHEVDPDQLYSFFFDLFPLLCLFLIVLLYLIGPTFFFRS